MKNELWEGLAKSFPDIGKSKKSWAKKKLSKAGENVVRVFWDKVDKGVGAEGGKIFNVF